MFKIVVFINLHHLVGKKLYRGYQTKPNPKALSTFNSSSCCVFLYLLQTHCSKVSKSSLTVWKLESYCNCRICNGIYRISLVHRTKIYPQRGKSVSQSHSAITGSWRGSLLAVNSHSVLPLKPWQKNQMLLNTEPLPSPIWWLRELSSFRQVAGTGELKEHHLQPHQCNGHYLGNHF